MQTVTNYIVLKVTTRSELVDLLKADLAELGFDCFLEDGDTFETSILSGDFNKQHVEEAISRYANMMPLEYTFETVEKQNWNELWEQNYSPISISTRCLIRADFHDIPGRENYDYEIIITPKMSFGTGHHETTSLMLEYQLEIDHTGKKIVDLGCGTGVLAIMGMKLGAVAADACDIEDWSVENTLENAQVNQVEVHAFQGTAADIAQHSAYDIVLANINLNVLLSEMEIYASLLKQGGTLLLSGFHEKDAVQIREKATACGFTPLDHKVKNNWTAMRLSK